MLRQRTIRRLRSASRLATAWLLVATYAATALGIPIPLPSTIEIGGTPFPCQAHRCGCNTAEQCWKSCCCHTNSEKLAWADAHDVTPPAYVIAAAARESATPTVSRGCCSHKASPRSTAAQSTAAHSTCTSSESTGPAADSKTSIVWVSALDARRCRGEVAVWNNVPISLAPGFPLSTPAFEPCIRSLTEFVAADPLVPCFAPPDPPPWLG